MTCGGHQLDKNTEKLFIITLSLVLLQETFCFKAYFISEQYALRI